MTLSRVRSAGSLLALALLGASCLRTTRHGVGASVPIPIGVVAESRTIDSPFPVRAGQLSTADLDTIAVRIRSLRAAPDSLTAEVGDTLLVPALLQLFAIDSAGSTLGELPYYDFGYGGRGFRLLADGRLYVSRKGTIRFRARLPAQYWRGTPSSRPSAEVSLVVRR